MPTFIDLTNIDVSSWLYQLLTLTGKGIIILGLTGLVAYTMRSSSAAVRYMIWSTGVLSLMFLPLFVSALPDWEISVLPAQQSSPSYVAAPAPAFEGSERFAEGIAEWEGVASSPAPAPRFETEENVLASAGPTWIEQFASLHWTTWLFGIWCLGVLVILTRLFIAHIGAIMLVRKGELVHDDDWHLLAEAVQEKLGITHIVRLRYSSWTTVPMSVGVFKSYVVLPVTADSWDEEKRRTVMVHEMAHIKRKDCLLHLLTQITGALYWLNPLVWVAAWQLRIERERACDDIVLQYGINPSSYAETLLQTARSMKRAEWSTVAAVSMARHSQLEGRLLSILDPMRRRSLTRLGSMLSISLVAVVAIPLAILTPVQAQEASPRKAAPPQFPEVAAVPEIDIQVPDVEIPEMDFEFPGITIPEMDIEIPEIEIPNLNIEIPSIDIQIPEIEVPEFEVAIPEIALEGERYPSASGNENSKTDSLTIDQIIKLRKYGIDASFIRSLKDLGYDTISYGELLSLGKYGADAEYITEMNQAGYPDFSLMDYAYMSKYGVDAYFVAEMNDAGFDDLSAEDLINMSKYGVDEDLVALMVQFGYDDMSVNEIISVSKYGVDEDLVVTLNKAGFDNLTIDELIGMSKYGVDGDLIVSLANNGYSDLSSSDLINASKYGLDEDLIDSLGDAGYSGLYINELISMSKYGVDEDLIRVLGYYGYTDLSADELIETSKYGVDEDLIVALQENGFQKVTIKEIISMSKYGVDEDLVAEVATSNWNVGADELIRMQKYGVDAEYIREMMKADIKNLTIDQIIEMKKHGVDPEYVRELRGN